MTRTQHDTRCRKPPRGHPLGLGATAARVVPTQINEILAAPDRFDRISLCKLADANLLSLLRLAVRVTVAVVGNDDHYPLGSP